MADATKYLSKLMFSYNSSSEEEKLCGTLLYNNDLDIQLNDKRLNHIAALTYNSTSCEHIFAILQKAISPTDNVWKTIYKALLIVHTILLYGSELSIDASINLCKFIYPLQQYNSALVKKNALFSVGGTDYGAPVRQEATFLATTLMNDNNIRQVRLQARQRSENSLVPLGDDFPELTNPAQGKGMNAMTFGQGVNTSVGAGFGLEAVPGMYEGRPERYFDARNDPRGQVTQGNSQITRDALAPSLLDLVFDDGSNGNGVGNAGNALPQAEYLPALQKQQELEKQLREQQALLQKLQEQQRLQQQQEQLQQQQQQQQALLMQQQQQQQGMMYQQQQPMKYPGQPMNMQNNPMMMNNNMNNSMMPPQQGQPMMGGMMMGQQQQPGMMMQPGMQAGMMQPGGMMPPQQPQTQRPMSSNMTGMMMPQQPQQPNMMMGGMGNGMMSNQQQMLQQQQAGGMMYGGGMQQQPQQQPGMMMQQPMQPQQQPMMMGMGMGMGMTTQQQPHHVTFSNNSDNHVDLLGLNNNNHNNQTASIPIPPPVPIPPMVGGGSGGMMGNNIILTPTHEISYIEQFAAQYHSHQINYMPESSNKNRLSSKGMSRPNSSYEIDAASNSTLHWSFNHNNSQGNTERTTSQDGNNSSTNNSGSINVHDLPLGPPPPVPAFKPPGY